MWLVATCVHVVPNGSNKLTVDFLYKMIAGCSCRIFLFCFSSSYVPIWNSSKNTETHSHNDSEWFCIKCLLNAPNWNRSNANHNQFIFVFCVYIERSEAVQCVHSMWAHKFHVNIYPQQTNCAAWRDSARGKSRTEYTQRKREGEREMGKKQKEEKKEVVAAVDSNATKLRIW